MIGIDFNLHLTLGQYTFVDLLKGLANACWTNSFLTTVRLSSKKTIRQMRSQISRQLQDKNFFMFRSISLHGIRSDNVPPKSSRHRNLPESNATETLSLRNSRKSFTQHFGKGKRKSRLANICRLRTGFDKQRSKALRQRRLWSRTKANNLCSGFNNNRFMPFTVSMGKVSQTQSCSQGTYANGSEGLYTLFYPHYRWKSTRCKYPRRTDFRAG